MNTISSLTQLPSELIHQIYANLGDRDLARLARTCRLLTSHAYNESLWKNFLQDNIPTKFMPSLSTTETDSSEVVRTYREIYANHHPYWFIAKNKIWFSEEKPLGKIILSKYNPQNNRIEGYQLTAHFSGDTAMAWDFYPRVLIFEISFHVKLSTIESFFSLPGHSITSPREIDSKNVKEAWWANGIKLRSLYKQMTDDHIVFRRNLEEKDEAWSNNEYLRPPRIIPGMPRVWATRFLIDSSEQHRTSSANVSQTVFDIHNKAGSQMSTWSTLDPSLYTPTKEKPYQGIYVGDYSSHGCEFILVMHVDTPPEIPPLRPGPPRYYDPTHISMVEQMSLEAGTDAENAQIQPVLADEAAHTGALVGIKLTGDPNVRRGEYTFIASDISRTGTIRIAEEEPFKGARIVESHGHVAEHGFRDDEYIKTQLILTNSNKIAQFWLGWDHIAFYERIDIDALLDTAP